MSFEGNKYVKKAHEEQEWTAEDIVEVKMCVEDPIYFIEKYIRIQHPVHGELPFVLYPFQRELIKAYHENKDVCAMIGRQSGKSTCAVAYLLWYAMFHNDKTILIASNKNDSALEIMGKIRYAYEKLPDFIKAGMVTYNKKSLEFDNGSSIFAQATTENTGRGYAISILYLDEFAFVRPSIAKEFWTAITPTLSTGGRCIITTTPNTDEDQFAQIWFGAIDTFDSEGNETELGKNGFKPFLATWEDHPERDQNWADSQIAKVGMDRFRREFQCEFISADETLINGAKLLRMKGVEPYMKTGQVRWYEPLKNNKTYVMGLDPSMGTGGDPAAIQLFELPSMIQTAEWRYNKANIEEQISLMQKIGNRIKEETNSELFWSVENNSLGEAALVVIRDIGEDLFHGDMVSEPKKSRRGIRKGFTTTNKSKLVAASKLKLLIESDRIDIRSKALISELKNFVAHGVSFRGKIGTTDDLIMATLLVMRIIQAVSKWDDCINDTFQSSLEDTDMYSEPMPLLI